MLAFFLGMGIAAHCFDLIQGDPLKLGLKTWRLWLVGLVALAGAVAIGVWQISTGNVPLALIYAVAIGGALAVGYGKEWPGLHGDWQFAAWWAVFPLLVGYFAQGINFTHLLVPVIILTFLTAAVQRVLSTRVRYLRRRVGDVCVVNVQESGSSPQSLSSGYSWMPVFNKSYDKSWLLAPDEKALALLCGAMVLTAGAGLIRHI